MKNPVRSLSIPVAACLLVLAGCAEDDPPAAANTAGGGAGGSLAGGGAGGAGANTSGSTTAASATIMPLAGQTLTGTANFASTAAGVTLQLSVQNCPPGDHPFHIHQGSSCTDMTTQGAHWDGDGTPEMPTRGETIPPITCAANMTGMIPPYTRPATSPANMLWTIGGDAATNVKGHVIVIHTSSTDKTRLACGVIN